jgi:hypothetical protein
MKRASWRITQHLHWLALAFFLPSVLSVLFGVADETAASEVFASVTGMIALALFAVWVWFGFEKWMKSR